MTVTVPKWSVDKVLFVLDGPELIEVGAEGRGSTAPPTNPSAVALAPKIMANIAALS